MDSQNSTPPTQFLQHPIPSPPHNHEIMEAPQPHQQQQPPPTTPPPTQPHQQENDMVRVKVTFHQPGHDHETMGASPTSTPHGHGMAALPTSTLPPHSHETMAAAQPKKRGRPRKSQLPQNTSGLGVSPTPVMNQVDSTPAAPSTNPAKKARGRPPGSGKKQHPEALGAVGFGPMHQIIQVGIGEDVLSKIVTFSKQGPPAVCILSGSGDLCNVTFLKSATGDGTVMHEGRFAITSLSGSYIRLESGIRGGLTLSMSRPDGSVFGGVIAGMVTAATPVQVAVRSFIPDMEKPESESPSSTPTSTPVTEATSPSQVPQASTSTQPKHEGQAM